MVGSGKYELQIVKYEVRIEQLVKRDRDRGGVFLAARPSQANDGRAEQSEWQTLREAIARNTEQIRKTRTRNELFYAALLVSSEFFLSLSLDALARVGQSVSSPLLKTNDKRSNVDRAEENDLHQLVSNKRWLTVVSVPPWARLHLCHVKVAPDDGLAISLAHLPLEFRWYGRLV